MRGANMLAVEKEEAHTERIRNEGCPAVPEGMPDRLKDVASAEL
eukprot:CAMPEP_0183376418 /NCGR_PEP_ID=MMETSP0164_2-20130417/120227_1 /TAXON_ID=221442 /ORGANISM="Coccolithus pelagicus ssp braarudi, Strain PLY182g" /LENGTH=43 /DNA_ID= /DNA_START= /DNA_END= /DNA_ORIENTATION=